MAVLLFFPFFAGVVTMGIGAEVPTIGPVEPEITAAASAATVLGSNGSVARPWPFVVGASAMESMVVEAPSTTTGTRVSRGLN